MNNQGFEFVQITIYPIYMYHYFRLGVQFSVLKRTEYNFECFKPPKSFICRKEKKSQST